jgi:hypothetical protein
MFVGFKVFTVVVTLSSEIQRRVVRWKSTSVSEEHVASFLAYRNKPRKKTLKMEAKYLSETSLDFQRTARRYMPEDRTICLKTMTVDEII